MIFTLCDYFKALKSEKHAAAKLLLLMICQSFNEAMLQTFKQPQKVSSSLPRICSMFQTLSKRAPKCIMRGCQAKAGECTLH